MADGSVMIRLVALGQGAYYILTGIWPIVSMATFEAITGPKTDTWLVQTVGALVLVIGVTLLAGVWHGPVEAGRRRLAVGPLTALLGTMSAVAFILVDVVFHLRGEIGAIYLADAAVHLVILGLWVPYWVRLRAASPRPA